MVAYDRLPGGDLWLLQMLKVSPTQLTAYWTINLYSESSISYMCAWYTGLPRYLLAFAHDREAELIVFNDEE